MAKQLVSPIERHIEKVVLALVGVALLGTVAMYLVTSPNKIEVASEMVRPGEIDRIVLEKAELVRDRLESAKPIDDPVEPLYDDFRAQVDALSLAGVSLELPTVVAGGPNVPIIDKAAKTTQDRKLVDVMPMGKPVVITGRSSLLVDPDGLDGGRFVQADWATISSVFEVRKQSEKQQLEYGRTLAEVVLGALRCQRRAQRLDGSWSEGDWETITGWPALDLGDGPPVVLTEDNGEIICAKKDFGRISHYYDSLKELPTQLGLLRPMMAEMRDGDPWDVPVVTSRHDVLVQDMGYLFPNDPPEPPEDRYDLGAAVPTAGAAATVDQTTPTALFELARASLATGRKTCAVDDATRAYNFAQEVTLHKSANRSQKAQAQRLMKDAENLTADIRRRICKPAGTRIDDQEDKRDKPPIQQMWVHDARPNSIQAGGTYQYRVRPLIFNRLAAQPTMFSDPQMAKTLFIEGPWSEPSEPVTFEPATYYYATGSSDRDDVVTMEIYKWFEGNWVRTKPKFGPGERVLARKRHDVPSQAVEGEVESPLITFDAGITVVDIDHERMYRSRKRGGRGTVVLENPAEACSVVFVDADGHLRERFVPLDKGNPGKSVNSARVYKAPKQPR